MCWQVCAAEFRWLGDAVPDRRVYVFDFCGNLEFFSQDLPGAEGSLQKSLSQRLFEARLGLLQGLDAAHADTDLRASTSTTLYEFVAGMSLDNVLVRPHRQWVERFAEPDAWTSLSNEDAEGIAHHLAGLPSAAQDDDEEAKRFDLLVLRRQLAQLDGDAVTAGRIREQVQATAAALLSKTAIPSVAQQVELLDAMAGDEWWVDVTLPMLELARLRIRGLVRFGEKPRRNPVYTDFVDELGEAHDVDPPGITPGTDFQRFRSKAAAYLRRHEDNITLRRLRHNKQLTDDDLSVLERMLLESGVGQQADIDRAVENTRGLGLFIRSLVGLDRQAATEAFAHYLDGGSFTLEQIRFVQLIVDELTANGVVEPGRLFESPYTDHAPTGPDYLFPDPDVDVIVGILHDVKAHAQPAGVA